MTACQVACLFFCWILLNTSHIIVLTFSYNDFSSNKTYMKILFFNMPEKNQISNCVHDQQFKR